MKNLQKIIMVVMITSIMASIRYFSKPTVRTEVIVGTSADYPPFSNLDESGAIVGFDTDLIEEIFRRLHIAYRIENMPFDTLLPQLQLGAIDLIAAGMSPTPERARRVLFTHPHIEADPFVILVPAGSLIKNFEDLKGKQVAVNQGYVADMHLSGYPDITLLRLPSISDGLLALTHGKVDAFVTGYHTLKPMAALIEREKLRFITLDTLQESTAFGVSCKNKELAEKINGVLDELKADGTLAALREKWKML